MLRVAFLASLISLVPGGTRACDLALFLAVDISGSVDPVEYRIQRDGLAAALQDGVVAEALVRAKARVSVMQWTGSSRQKITIPWTAIETFEDVDALAKRVASEERIWRNFSTAIGEALQIGQAALREVPECRRKVIDVSGDGPSNEGVEPRSQHAGLRKDGITVNALVIEEAEENLTSYFWENVITGEGAFVVTANTFEDYPDRIRRKLIRETARVLAAR